MRIDSSCHFSSIASAAVVAMLLVQVASAQGEKGPKKTGVADTSVQHAMSELKPDATFPVAGHPDWLGITEDGLWVSSSNVNHVVRLNATTNKPDITIDIQKPCSGLAVDFGSLWIPSCGSHNLVRANVAGGEILATIPVDPAESEGGITTGAGSVWLVTPIAGEKGTGELDPDRREDQCNCR